MYEKMETNTNLILFDKPNSSANKSETTFHKPNQIGAIIA